MKFLGTIQIVEDLQNAKGENCLRIIKPDKVDELAEIWEDSTEYKRKNFIKEMTVQIIMNKTKDWMKIRMEQ